MALQEHLAPRQRHSLKQQNYYRNQRGCVNRARKGGAWNRCCHLPLNENGFPPPNENAPRQDPANYENDNCTELKVAASLQHLNHLPNVSDDENAFSVVKCSVTYSWSWRYGKWEWKKTLQWNRTRRWPLFIPCQSARGVLIPNGHGQKHNQLPQPLDHFTTLNKLNRHKICQMNYFTCSGSCRVNGGLSSFPNVNIKGSFSSIWKIENFNYFDEILIRNGKSCRRIAESKFEIKTFCWRRNRPSNPLARCPRRP